jgi:uncharacterized membrane protein
MMERLKYLVIWVIISTVSGATLHYVARVDFFVAFFISLLALTLNGLIMSRRDSS